MDIAVTKMSSRGQIVIPSDMREDMEDGEKMIIIKDDGEYTLKRVKNMSNKIEEDIEFARRTEEAWKEYDAGKFTSSSASEFIKEMRSWRSK